MEDATSATVFTNTTTALSTLSPIDKLNEDIIWRIFWENTDMFDKDPMPSLQIDENNNEGSEHLDNLRRTGQVCRLWREIIMDSGALWGRVINLDVLQRENQACWRREVIVRAKHAPLHIVGYIKLDSAEFRVFFGELLNERWSSIQRFAMTVAGKLDPEQVNPEMWLPLQRPSPNLQTFSLLFEDKTYPIFKTSNLPLFGNKASSLRTLSFRGVPKAQFSLQAPWLHQLRSLQLFLKVPSFSATDFMTLLSSMPYLASLSLNNSLFEPTSNEYSRNVSLKFLSRLCIKDTFGTSLLLMKYIIPSSRCLLDLDVGRTFGFISDSEVQDMCLALSRYTTSYLKDEQNSAESLSLVLFPGQFIFTAPNFPHAVAQKTQFFIAFANQFPSALFSGLLLTVLKPNCFPHVKTFQLMTSNNTISFLDAPWQQEVVTTFLTSLVSVTELRISVAGIHTILQVQISDPDVFPSLQILHLQDKRQFRSPSFPENTLRFLETSISRGRPVATLVLPDVTEQEKTAALKHLDVIQGLRVIWGTQEYICGSGSTDIE